MLVTQLHPGPPHPSGEGGERKTRGKEVAANVRGRGGRKLGKERGRELTSGKQGWPRRVGKEK